MTINKFNGAVKRLFDKDHFSNTLSVIAVIISIFASGYTYLQFNMDKGTGDYEFWRHINRSLDSQQRIANKLYPRLFYRAAMAEHVLREIHKNIITCKKFRTYSPNVVNNADIPKNILRSLKVQRYEDDEIYDFQSTVLENKYMANVLTIKGWASLVNEQDYSSKWWNTLSWDSMHLVLFPIIWKWQCVSSGKVTIKIPNTDLETFKTSLATVMIDNTDIENRNLPNINYLKNLEAENMPNAEVAYKPINYNFDKDNLKQVEKELGKLSR